MRIPILTKLLLAGAGASALAYLYGRSRGGTRAPLAADPEPTVIPDSMDIDPADPVQGIDDVHQFHIEDLAVDAMADAEADYDEASVELDAPAETTLDAIERAAHDVGDLYGSHTPPAVDRDHPDDREAMAEGQTWLEALETSAVENGADPDHGLDEIVDDDDVNRAPHPSDTRDTPVADRGAGGPAGI